MPEVLSTSEPVAVLLLEITTVLPAGRADTASIRRAPPPLAIVVVPVYVFTPVSTVVAVPVFVTPPVPPAPTMLLAIVPSTLARVRFPVPPAANVMSPVPCEPAAPIVIPPEPAWTIPPANVLAEVVLVRASVPPPEWTIPAVPLTGPVNVVVEPASLLTEAVAASVMLPERVKPTALPERSVAVPEANVIGSGMGAAFADARR